MPATTLLTISHSVWGPLASQSLHPAEVTRALPGARQGMRRVRRARGRAMLSTERLTLYLLRTALALVPDSEVRLILDTTRYGRWETFTLGRAAARPRAARRLEPLALPLAQGHLHRHGHSGARPDSRTLADWPAVRPVHSPADRGFPSLKLFAVWTDGGGTCAWATRCACGRATGCERPTTRRSGRTAAPSARRRGRANPDGAPRIA